MQCGCRLSRLAARQHSACPASAQAAHQPALRRLQVDENMGALPVIAKLTPDVLTHIESIVGRHAD